MKSFFKSWFSGRKFGFLSNYFLQMDQEDTELLLSQISSSEKKSKKKKNDEGGDNVNFLTTNNHSQQKNNAPTKQQNQSNNSLGIILDLLKCSYCQQGNLSRGNDNKTVRR